YRHSMLVGVGVLAYAQTQAGGWARDGHEFFGPGDRPETLAIGRRRQGQRRRQEKERSGDCEPRASSPLVSATRPRRQRPCAHGAHLTSRFPNRDS
ncbi:MAG TPA: hypothetical protein VGP46_12145, partial [Acidimicrobiales bacterium]|nr:hypothetical protein [Acidimicrobiales bacterium]